MDSVTGFLRWFYSGYDWPLYKDWLAWVGLLVTAIVTTIQVERVDTWVLLTAPLAFAFYGWLLGAARNLWRGYREARPARP